MNAGEDPGSFPAPFPSCLCVFGKDPLPGLQVTETPSILAAQ